MSEAPKGLFTTAIFNPALLRKDDLVGGFVARQDLLTRLLDDLRRVPSGTAPQHQMLIGQRGLGKTTLLRRLAFAIEDDALLSAKWIPLVFPEEQYNIRNLGDFWLNCADALSDALDHRGDTKAAEALDRKVEAVPQDPERRSTLALAVLIDEAQRLERGLVLLVDNLDIILDRLDDKQEWEFRRVISAEARLYFVGASSRALEAVYEHGRAFYDYFQVHDLKGFSDADTFALLTRLAESAGDERVSELLRTQPARVRALRVLTGGNPRTLVLLYRVLSQGPEGDVERDVEQLLDLYTPLYKARFEEMAEQAQQVVDAMAIHWDPVTAGDLTEILAPMSVNQVSAQLKRLEDFGVLEKTPWFGEKKAAFQIAERFFNVWYLMRASRRVRRKLIWLVRFLEAWFERDEIDEYGRKYLHRDPNKVGTERYAEMALAYSQTVSDRHLRRNLESAGLRAAMDCSVRDLIDFSDLPPEVLDRKQRMERLRELQKRVLGFHAEGLDSAELWRLLGGSPHLSLEEKAKVVDELPTLGTTGVQQLLAKLAWADERLNSLYSECSAEVARLNTALSTGEMGDVYDMEGALALAIQLGYERLPAIAVGSRISLWCNPEHLSEREARRAESALQGLISEPGHSAKAWQGLGILFADRLGRYEEAEQAFRRSIELDPQYARPWHGLGLLLQEHLKRYEEAEQAYRRVIDLDPQDVASWNNLGNLLQGNLGRPEEAEQAYQRSIKSDPQHAWPWNNLGLLLTDRPGRREEAEQAFRHSIKLDSQYVWPCNNLGSLLLSDLGRYEEAEQLFRRAIEIDPGIPHPWGNLGILLESDTNRRGEALISLVKAAERDPSNEQRRSQVLYLARKMSSAPDSTEALESVSRFVALFPDYDDARFVLAGLHVRNGDWPQARALFETLASSEIENPDIESLGIAVAAGHSEDLIAILEKTGANERWRPLYEALKAVQAGSAQYLRRVAPEVRIAAQEILKEIAPELRGD